MRLWRLIFTWTLKKTLMKYNYANFPSFRNVLPRDKFAENVQMQTQKRVQVIWNMGFRIFTGNQDRLEQFQYILVNLISLLCYSFLNIFSPLVLWHLFIILINYYFTKKNGFFDKKLNKLIITRSVRALIYLRKWNFLYAKEQNIQFMLSAKSRSSKAETWHNLLWSY